MGFIANLLVTFANGKFGDVLELERSKWFFFVKKLGFLSFGDYQLPLCLFSVLFDKKRNWVIHYEKRGKWITLNTVLVAHQMEALKKTEDI